MKIAMKISRQYHVEKQPSEPMRDRFISRRQSYHIVYRSTVDFPGSARPRAN